VKRPKTLRAVQPNAGIRAKYQRRLERQIAAMIKSYRHFLLAAYRRNPPAIAMDATSSKELEYELRTLGRRWRKSFEDMADGLGNYFAKSVATRSDAALRKIMKDAGWTVRLKMTEAMRDVLNATVEENVSLIRSIPQQFHYQVEGLVMRSVAAGRDLGTLKSELETRFKITRKRAELIARDQNNKATNQLARVRQIEMGIEEAVWMHSHAGKQPRPTHKKNHGRTFDLAKGWYDPAVQKHILPGELINCRCTSKPIVKGFS
jgi:SPP1 gp7 family putative phage head morphogenesis protein